MREKKKIKFFDAELFCEFNFIIQEIRKDLNKDLKVIPAYVLDYIRNNGLEGKVHTKIRSICHKKIRNHDHSFPI